MKQAKCSVFVAVSLDGYIARKDGGLDWLEAANATVTRGEDCGYAQFMQSIDAIVMGRKSYEKVRSFGEWPYGDTAVVVLGRTALEIPDSLSSTVSRSSETPEALCKRLAGQGNKRLYIDGGMTIQRFLAAGLITDLTITTIPVILGRGIPLFGRLDRDIALKHVSTTSYEFGFVQSTYDVVG